MSDLGILVLGVDPGLSGALAWYYPDHPAVVGVDDMPVAGGDVDPDAIADSVWKMAPDFAVVEAVHSMPKQGVASSFKFGRSYGAVLGVLAACKVPVHLVAPTVWKRHFRLSADKDQSRALAIRLWPGSDRFRRRKDDGRAEAALIARWGAETTGKPRSKEGSTR